MISLSPHNEGLPSNGTGLLRSPWLWSVALRAVWELALARLALGRRSARDLFCYAQKCTKKRDCPDAALPARVAWAIPRIAARVPWRADCLVQALAARRWLARKSIASNLCIGTRKDRCSGFEAHAWLCVDQRVITGGDIDEFVSLVGRQEQEPAAMGLE